MSHKPGNFRAEFFAVIGAVIFAPVVIASVSSVYTGLWPVWPLVFVVALVWTIVFALPVYLVVLKPRNWMEWWTGPLCGFLAGAIPTAFMLILTKNDSSMTKDGVTTHYVTNYVPTMDGWIKFSVPILQAGMLGLCGGTAAWVIWKLVHKYCYRSYAGHEG